MDTSNSPSLPSSGCSNSFSMIDEYRPQLDDFLKKAPRRLYFSLENNNFEYHLQKAFKSINHGSVTYTDLHGDLKSVQKKLSTLESDDPNSDDPCPPPEWIKHKKPLADQLGLFNIIQKWKQSNPEYNFQSLRCYLLSRCFREPVVLPNDEEVGEYLIHAFIDIEYEGDTAKRFNHFVCDSLRNFRAELYYGATIPILQSSGTGKSRLASEMKNYWPTLSLCLRTPDSKFKNGYLLCDQPVANYFLEQAVKLLPNPCVMAFLSAWLDVAFEELTSIPLDASMKDIMAVWDLVPNPTVQNLGLGLSSLASPVRTNNGRSELFQDAVAKAVEKIATWHNPGLRGDAELKAMVQHFLLNPMQRLGNRLIKFNAVQQQKQDFRLEKPLVCLVVDECSFLKMKASTEVGKPKNDWDGLQALRRAMFLIDRETIDIPVRYVLLLLDTNSSVLEMLPLGTSVTSERERDRKRLDPWVNLGFDVMKTKQQPLATPREALGLQHLCLYGRPLWSSYPVGDALKHAINKLFPSSFSSGDKQHVLACLSVRVGLDVVPLSSDQSGFEVAATAVNRSMRLLKRLQPSHVTLATVAPSEPLLALASWTVLIKNNKYSEVLTAFKTDLLVLGCIKTQGSLGEFVCRLLIIMARDAAVQIKLPRPFDLGNQPGNQLKETTINVGQFLSQLVECENFQKLFAPYPNRLPPLMSPDLLQSGMINVTHIDVTEALYVENIDARLLWKWWKRGLAIQCVHNQPGIDGIIPVYVGDLDEHFGLKKPASVKEMDKDASCHMTYIGWQAKNKTKGVKVTGSVQGPKVIGGSHPTALFTILFELGVEASLRKPFSREKPYYDLSAPKIPTNTEAQGANPTTPAETLFPILRIRGIQQAYPCLDRWNSRSNVSDILNGPRPKGVELSLDIRTGTITPSGSPILDNSDRLGEELDEDVEMEMGN